MKRADILEAARQAVTSDRAATHGKPENTFGLIAGLWSARLGHAISPAQVTIMLIDLKTALAWGNLGHMDNWVDIAGYAACGGELAAEAASLKAAAEIGVISLDEAMDMIRDEAGQENIALGEAMEIIKAEAAAKAAGWYLEDGILRLDREGVPARAIAYNGPKSWRLAALVSMAEKIEKQDAARIEPEPDRCEDCGVERPDFRAWRKAHLCDSCETKRAFGMPKEGGETRTASMAEIKAMIASGEVRQPSPDAPEYDMPEGFLDGAVLMPPSPDQSPVAVVDFAEEATAEALAKGNAKSEAPTKTPANSKKCVRCALNGVDKTADFLIGQDHLCSEHFAKFRDGWMGIVDTIKAKPLTEQADVAPETPALSPAPEAEKRHHAAKWTPEMDAKLIGGIAAKVANGMSRTAAANATAKEIGMGEKACVVRAQNVLLAQVTEAIGLAKAAKNTAADLAKTMATAPAPQPLSKRLSTPPNVALNIDMHLAECRAEGWAYADDLHLFEMVVDQGYGMGDVALDMGRDSKAIKDRYDRLTGIYQDANNKWCRKYMRDDVLAALRQIVKSGGGVK